MLIVGNGCAAVYSTDKRFHSATVNDGPSSGIAPVRTDALNITGITDVLARLRQDRTTTAATGLARPPSCRRHASKIGAVSYGYTDNALEQLAVRTQASPAATTRRVEDMQANPYS